MSLATARSDRRTCPSASPPEGSRRGRRPDGSASPRTLSRVSRPACSTGRSGMATLPMSWSGASVATDRCARGQVLPESRVGGELLGEEPRVSLRSTACRPVAASRASVIRQQASRSSVAARRSIRAAPDRRSAARRPAWRPSWRGAPPRRSASERAATGTRPHSTDATPIRPKEDEADNGSAAAVEQAGPWRRGARRRGRRGVRRVSIAAACSDR